MKSPVPALLRLALAGMLAVGVARADEHAEVQRLQATGQTGPALARAEQFLAAKPKDAPMRFLRGVLLAESRREAEASEVFQRLVEDYPELPEPYNNLAALYAAAGDYDRAKAALDQAVRANPSFAAAHENLGDVLAMMALRAYQRAQQLEPANAALPGKLKLVRQLLGRPAP
ncbi:MAG: tetratricopeptide repeat protein [Piscinibacter sp.]|uniref:tetratricopeptide repeat protein n=1 Tax=Piscinibacter sp. TaxID=1903157 RepID=UPI000FDF0992|nr:tetratricopeptide repeat protein [Piscinibacter sp.]MCW5664014.1 tetratricopeptide repeat protein [Piscinibacter sp.]